MNAEPESRLITIKEMQELLGVDKPQPCHQFIKRFGIDRVKVDGHTFVVRADVLAALAGQVEKVKAAPKSVNGSGSGSVSDAKKMGPELIKPFDAAPELAMWNRGKWQGWAVASVESVDPQTVEMITSYGRKYLWEKGKVVADFASGASFFNEPQEILGFVALQLLRVKSAHPEMATIIKDLVEVSSKLAGIRDDLKNFSGAQAGGSFSEASDLGEDAPLSEEE